MSKSKGNKGSQNIDPPDEEWLRTASGLRSWWHPDVFAQGGHRRQIWEINEVVPTCEACAKAAHQLSLLRSRAAALAADHVRIGFLLEEYPGPWSEDLRAALDYIEGAIPRFRTAIVTAVAELIRCEIEHCGLSHGGSLQRAKELMPEAPTASGGLVEEVVDVEGEVDSLAEAFWVETDGKDARREVCEPCRKHYDALVLARIALEEYEEYPAGFDRFDPADLDTLRHQVKVAVLRLELCERFLCDLAAVPAEREAFHDDFSDANAEWWAAIAELRDFTECEYCEALCDAVGRERVLLRESSRDAARLQRRSDGTSDPDLERELRAEVAARMASAKDHEVRIEVLRDLLRQCEAQMCPEVEVAEVESAAEVELVDEGAGDPEVDDEKVDDLETVVGPRPTAEQVAAWKAGGTVPREWWEAAKQIGWKGQIRGWRPPVLQPMPIPYQLDRFAIEESCRAWGIDIVGLSLISSSSEVYDDSRRTVIYYPIDQHGKPIDRRLPYWMRANQKLTAVVFIELVHVDTTDGSGGWGASVKVYITKNDRLLDAKIHWKRGDISDYFLSPYQALYRCLVGISDENRELRRKDRLAPKPPPVDLWADATGFANDAGEDDPSGEDPFADDYQTIAAEKIDSAPDPGPPTTTYGEEGPPEDQFDDPFALEIDLPPDGDAQPTIGESAAMDPQPYQAQFGPGPSVNKRKRSRVIAAGAAASAAAGFGIFLFSCDGGAPRDPFVDAIIAENAVGADLDEQAAIIEALEDGSTNQAAEPISPLLGEPLPQEVDPASDPLVPAAFWSTDDPLPFFDTLPENVSVSVDPSGDFVFSISGTRVTGAGGEDILGVSAAKGQASPPTAEQAHDNTSFPCGARGEVDVFCAIGAGQFPAGEWLLIAVELDAFAPERGVSYQYGLAIDPDGDEGDNYHFAPPFDWDLFRNTEQWWRVEIDAEGRAHMWADGFIDGTPGVPRYTAAVLIRVDNRLVWVIPAEEVGGNSPRVRVTAFRNSRPGFGIPSPEFSAGDVNGADPTAALFEVPADIYEIGVRTDVWPDVEGSQRRLDITLQNAEPVWRRALLEDLAQRATEAFRSEDPEAGLDLLHPEVLSTYGEEACGSMLAATLAQADSIELAGDPIEAPELGSAGLQANFLVRYPTGDVQSPLAATTAGDGRLYFVFPCQ